LVAFGQALRLATSVYYIKWNNIQQSVYTAGNCGLQFTDNLGTAVAKGFDVQAELTLGPLSVDAAVGYTSARYTANSPHAVIGRLLGTGLGYTELPVAHSRPRSPKVI
jgi:outer membrane receptor protein involved in Fe transport